MDDKDQKIVAALRQNARISLSELAQRAGLSRATVRARMERLERSGEIIGYTVVLKGEEAELPVRGITMIEIEGKGNERILSQLRGFPEVRALHSTNGRWDIVVELATDTLPGLDQTLRRIRLLDGVHASETSLFLTTHRSQQAKPAS